MDNSGKKFKVVAIGDRTVGKTSIIARFSDKQKSKEDADNASRSSGRGSNSDSDEKADEKVAAPRSTIGASFCQVRLNTKSSGLITLNVWDTAGQERFRSMVGMYYRNADAALAVYDVTNHRSFLSLKKWIKELKENTRHDVVIIVVGNKTDLRNERTVDPKEAAGFAAAVGAGYVETTVKNPRKIRELFSDLAELLVKLPEVHNEAFADSFQIKQSPPTWRTRRKTTNKNSSLYGCCSFL